MAGTVSIGDLAASIIAADVATSTDSTTDKRSLVAWMAPSPAAVSTPRWLIPAIVAALLVVGAVVGFAATRQPEPSAAPIPAPTFPPSVTAPTATKAPTSVPTAAAPVRVTQLTFATPADGTSVCLQPVSFNLSVTLANAKPGDVVHVALTGPGMPSGGVSGPVDQNLTFTTKVGPVGPVKGTNQWSAQPDSVNGAPVVTGPATPLALCPNN